MAVTSQNFASSLLAATGKPQTAEWQAVVNTWVAAEGGFNPNNSGGARNNNPLNSGCTGWANQIGCATLSNGAKVGIYRSLDDAVASYSNGLNNYSQYAGIRNASSPTAMANAIIASPWAESHYRTKSGTLESAWSNFFGGNPPNPGSGVTNVVNTVTNSVATFLGLSGTDATKPLDETTARAAASKYAAANAGGNSRAYQEAYNNIYTLLRNWIGTPVNAVPFNVDASGQNTTQVVVPTPDQQASGDTQRGQLFNIDLSFIGDALLFIGIVLIGIVFIGSGAIITLRKKD